MKYFKRGSKDNILLAEEVFPEDQQTLLLEEFEERLQTPLAVVEKTFDEHGPITNRTKVFSAKVAAECAQQLFIGDELRYHIENWRDYAWRCFYNVVPKVVEYSISRYEDGGFYRWHCDHMEQENQRVMNFLYYMNSCEGGELDISTDVINKAHIDKHGFENFNVVLTVKPRRDLLVMFPSYYPHRVRLVKSQRDLLHGHLCF